MPVAGSWETLAEAQLLTRSDFVKGVIEEIIREGGILSMIPTRRVHGNNLLYNRENIIPSGTFHAIADAWTASEDINHTQVTTTLAIHGDMKYIDDFIKKTYDNENDMEAVVTQQTAKGLKQYLERRLVYEATSFSGLHNLVTAAQTTNQGSGATGAAMSAANLDTTVDLCRGGNGPDLLLMPHVIALRIDQSPRGGTTSYPVVMVMEQSAGGKMELAPKVQTWNGVKIMRSDFMATPGTRALRETIASGTFSAETGGATGSIFAIRFGLPEEGGLFLGIGNDLFEKIGPQESENRNAQWIRIRSYLAPGIGSTLCLSRLDGITNAPVVG